MKRYILLTLEELDRLVHGEEIVHEYDNGDMLFFMEYEHYKQALMTGKWPDIIVENGGEVHD